MTACITKEDLHQLNKLIGTTHVQTKVGEILQQRGYTMGYKLLSNQGEYVQGDTFTIGCTTYVVLGHIVPEGFSVMGTLLLNINELNTTEPNLYLYEDILYGENTINEPEGVYLDDDINYDGLINFDTMDDSALAYSENDADQTNELYLNQLDEGITSKDESFDGTQLLRGKVHVEVLPQGESLKGYTTKVVQGGNYTKLSVLSVETPLVQDMVRLEEYLYQMERNKYNNNKEGKYLLVVSNLQLLEETYGTIFTGIYNKLINTVWDNFHIIIVTWDREGIPLEVYQQAETLRVTEGGN